MCCKLQELTALPPWLAGDILHGKAPGGERARLVEDHGVNAREGLEVVAPLDEDAQAAGTPDAAEVAHGHADHQRAGARDHQEGKCAEDPVSPGAQAQQRRDHGEHGGGAHHQRRVDAGKARDEALCAGLLFCRTFDQLEYAAHGGVLIGLCHAHGERRADVDAARDELAAGLDAAGRAFARERRAVDARAPLDDDAVKRHALARTHQHKLAHLDLVGVDLLHTAGDEAVGEAGGDIHHLLDGAAALAHGVVLEELPHLEEEHDRGAFCHVRRALWEKDHEEGPEGGHHHEEVLVKRVAAGQVARGFDEDGVACEQVGHEEERKLRVDVVGGFQPAVQGEQHDDGEDE